MAAGSSASLAEEMSRFEEEISGAGVAVSSAPPPLSAPKTTGVPTQALPTGPSPAMFPPRMPMGSLPPPMAGPPGPGPIGPPGVPGGLPPPPVPGVGMPPPMGGGLPMPGMPPPVMPPMGQMPFMVPVPMAVPTPAVPVAMPGTAGGGAAAPDSLTDKQKKEWESQFSKGATAAAAGEDAKKKKKNLRHAAGVTWVDPSLDEWDESDFRIFAGDLGHECTDEVLFRAFSKYPSLKKCKVVRDSRTNKSRGYGFVSFRDPKDYLSAIREMNGKYVAGRPIKLRKSTWKDRQLAVARKKQKEKDRLGLK